MQFSSGKRGLKKEKKETIICFHSVSQIQPSQSGSGPGFVCWYVNECAAPMWYFSSFSSFLRVKVSLWQPAVCVWFAVAVTRGAARRYVQHESMHACNRRHWKGPAERRSRQNKPLGADRSAGWLLCTSDCQKMHTASHRFVEPHQYCVLFSCNLAI